MKIVVVGLGYVGLSSAILLAQHNDVVAVDILKDRVDKINNSQLPIEDSQMASFLETNKLNLRATLDLVVALQSADFVIISTPTNFDVQRNCFDTSSIELVAEKVTNCAPDALIVIKSTVPVGFTEKLKESLGNENIVFNPEFLREGSALADNLKPSRIVIGDRSPKAKKFVELLTGAAISKDIPVIFAGNAEAEAIKLFSNTYLANRVAFFNEIDNFAIAKGLNSRALVDGICADHRIGNYYNNPSFGYGGYCLPKDTRQVLSMYAGVPQKIIEATVDSNARRLDYLAEDIRRRKGVGVVGIYRLAMKANSDNCRESSAIELGLRLMNFGIKVLVFEPYITSKIDFDFEFVSSLEELSHRSDLIIANRVDEIIRDVSKPIYTRDIFGVD